MPRRYFKLHWEQCMICLMKFLYHVGYQILHHSLRGCHTICDLRRVWV